MKYLRYNYRFLAIPIILVSSLGYFQCSQTVLVAKEVNIIAHPMMYACGDCYDIFAIKWVESPHNDLQLTGKEIILDLGPFLEDTEKIVAHCKICYDYEMTGDLVEEPGNQYLIFKAKDLKLRLREDCCRS